MKYVDETEFTTVQPECCGTAFGMPEWLYKKTKRTGETWYCPLGHPRVWTGDTLEQKLEKAEAQNQHLEDQLGAAIRDAEESRIALLRDRQRFAAGVCPCCNRSFGNVRRHMETKHPDYDVATVALANRRYKCSCGMAFESFKGLRIHQGHQRPNNWAEPGLSNWRAHLTRV